MIPLIPTQLTKLKNTKWYPKGKNFAKILGCVQCSTNGDSLGENKISTPSLVCSLCNLVEKPTGLILFLFNITFSINVYTHSWVNKSRSSFGVYSFPPSFLLTSIHVLPRQESGRASIGVRPFIYHSFSYGVASLSISFHNPDRVTLMSQTLLHFHRASIAPTELSTYPLDIYTIFI
jgi:hypothetical protein